MQEYAALLLHWLKTPLNTITTKNSEQQHTYCFYDRICTGINTERVVVDDYAGSFAAVEYMIQTGCKRILFYSGPPHLEISKNRRNGYLDAMRKYKVPVDDNMIKLCDTREQAIAITPDLLEKESSRRFFLLTTKQLQAFCMLVN